MGRRRPTDYDLSQHAKECGKPISYTDPVTGETYVPYVVEPSLGADRVVLAFLTDAYDEEVVDAEKNDVRTVLRRIPRLRPINARFCPCKKICPKRRTKFTR